MVEALVHGFLPEGWAARLDCATLERGSGSFVSDDLRERHNDLIWKLRWRDQFGGGSVYLLLEFQSTPDPHMPVRLLSYLGLLLQDLIRSKPAGKLPFVAPIVIYNGRPAWRVPLDLGELFSPPIEDPEAYLPRLHYVLLDERRLDLDIPKLAQNMAAAVFRIETCTTTPDLRRRSEELLNLLTTEDGEELRRSVAIWLRRKLRRILSGRIIVASTEEATMLEETILEWEVQFLEQGREQGRQEGRQVGLQEGIERGLRRGQRTGQIEGIRQVLLKQLQLKFGPLPPKARRDLEAIRRKRQLERLAGRILKAKSLAELGLG